MPEMMTNEEMKRRYKPRRPETTLEDVVTPEERQRRAQDVQQAKDIIEQPKIDETYMKSLTVTEPDKKASGGMTASARADGIAQRGKTRGTMVACGGGYMKGGK
jgi:hypothetical protein